MVRFALVSLARDKLETVSGYLPGNYAVIGTVEHADQYPFDGQCAVIQGRDNGGFTLDKYIIPRLSSGLIVAREIDRHHPAMERLRHFYLITGIDHAYDETVYWSNESGWTTDPDEAAIFTEHEWTVFNLPIIGDGLPSVRGVRWVRKGFVFTCPTCGTKSDSSVCTPCNA